ncbi:hypothetical protein L7F22_038877 [Adiantum nelumboides]|nr:hypothetical protein [Adiantum nelumboides]
MSLATAGSSMMGRRDEVNAPTEGHANEDEWSTSQWNTHRRQTSSRRPTNTSYIQQTPPRPSMNSFASSSSSSAFTPVHMMHSPSISSNAEGFFGRESRTDSIGTLWSSADVPLMFDGHRGSGGDKNSLMGISTGSVSMQASSSSRSGTNMSIPRGISFTTSSSNQTLHAFQRPSEMSTLPTVSDFTKNEKHDSSEPHELLLSDDGQEFVAVPTSNRKSKGSRPSTAKTVTNSSESPSSSLPNGWTVSNEDVVESNVALLQYPGSRPGSSSGGTGQKRRPAPLHLAEVSNGKSTGQSTLSIDRSHLVTDVPLSVSHGSQLTLKSQKSKSKLKGGNEQHNSRKPPSTSPATALPRRSPKTNSAELYKHAERFFDSSYSMAPPVSPIMNPNLALSTPDMARLSRFSDDSHVTYEEQTNSIGPMDNVNRTTGLSSARSQNSHSSAESSNTPEIVEQCANAATMHLLRSGITQEARNATLTYTNVQRSAKYDFDEEQPMTPLRVAMSLANPASPRLTEHQQNHTSMQQQSLHPLIHSPRRPSTTDSAIPTTPKSSHRPNVRHAHTSSDQEVLRRLREEAAKVEVIPPLPSLTNQKVDEKLAFLHAPASQPVPPSPKRGALFGLRIRAVSTPKLRQSRGGSQDGNGVAAGAGINSTLQAENLSRPTSSSRPQHPPQAPSGRFRTMTMTSDTERCDSISSANSVVQNGQRLSVTGSDEGSLNTSSQQSKSRRPSTSDALAAAARRLRRPSRNGSNSSLTAPLNTYGSQSVVDVSRQRVGSSASSQLNADLRHISSNASLRPNSRKSKSGGTPTNATRPKTKGGWASHLAQGLTLHIEQGNKKIAMRMNYQYYDPFGRPESLCTSNNVEEHSSQRQNSNGRIRNSFSTTAGQSSRNGSISVSNEENNDETTMGVLEFTPDVPSPGREGNSHNHLAFLSSDSKDTVILKHLTIGEDTRADLITRQADLSLKKNGVHEVSGSERKGKVSWRFEFCIEDVKRQGSIPTDNASTPKMDSKPFHETIDGIKLLRPIKFSCSTTLLDPSRARKSRVINIIRKQIGSHIESHSFSTNVENVESDLSAMHLSETPPTTMNQSLASLSPAQTSPLTSSKRLEAPLSPRSLPRSRQGSTPYARRTELPSPSPIRNAFNHHIEQQSPIQIRSPLHPPSSIGSSAGELGSSLGTDDHHLAALRNASVVSTTSSGAGSATWSPASRLVPFKARRAIVDTSKQIQGRPSIGEQGNTALANGLVANAGRSPLVIGTSLESPLATSIEASPSPRKFVRELGSNGKMQQPIKTTQQQHFPRKYIPPSTALGLETNPTNHTESKEDIWYDDSNARQWASSQSRTQSRRLRAVTSEGIHEAQTLDVRPPTASEEIKMAYLNNNASRLNTADSTASSTKSRSRHGGNGSGHGHSHSVIQTPLQHSEPTITTDSPPRRMTSASIHQHNEQYNRQIQQATPSSPLRKKDLPPTPSKKGPIAIASKAARAISGSSLKPGPAVHSNGKFDPPEGPFWI